MGIMHIKGHGEFQWDRNAATLAEAMMVEEATGRQFDELVALYNAGRVLGLTAFAMIALTRHGRHVPWPVLSKLPCDSIRQTYEDEQPAVVDPEDGGTPDPHEAPAAPEKAPRRRAASGPKKAVSPKR